MKTGKDTATDSAPIKRIVIVGGGTAGWSAAACLERFLANRQVSITLVESPQIGTVGVGEASIPNIRNFNAYIGLDELDFVRSTGGTFKLGIRFDDWRAKGHSFFHPFGNYGFEIEGLDFHQCLYHARQQGFSGELAEFSLPVALASQGKFGQPSPNPQALLAQFGYAFHFDAGRYAERLRTVATGRGVVHRQALIQGTRLHDETGFIEAVVLDDGSEAEGDLFVDCSGFRAILIEQALETGYESWRQWLPCDRAVALPCPREGDDVAPFTVASAQDAGWRWAIPLQQRMGNGYVYASDFADAEEATRTLMDAMAAEPSAQPNHQRFEAGMRRKFWHRNCVALGLASGFLEPLESTSINLVHRGLSVLMDHFPGKACDPRLANMANTIFTGEQERIRDFLILHYKLSQRTDTPFWRHVAAMEIPDSLHQKIEAWRANGSLLQGQYESFRPESWLTMYDGFGLMPDTLDTRTGDLDRGQLLGTLDAMRTNIAKGASETGTHADFIARHCGLAEPAL